MSNFGAAQSRFQSTIEQNNSEVIGLVDAKSRIINADYAEETAALTTNTILQQAGAAMLAQANQLPQIALKLLQG